MTFDEQIKTLTETAHIIGVMYHTLSECIYKLTIPAELLNVKQTIIDSADALEVVGNSLAFLIKESNLMNDAQKKFQKIKDDAREAKAKGGGDPDPAEKNETGDEKSHQADTEATNQPALDHSTPYMPGGLTAEEYLKAVAGEISEKLLKEFSNSLTAVAQELAVITKNQQSHAKAAADHRALSNRRKSGIDAAIDGLKAQVDIAVTLLVAAETRDEIRKTELQEFADLMHQNFTATTNRLGNILAAKKTGD